jgi:hypothetical protein
MCRAQFLPALLILAAPSWAIVENSVEVTQPAGGEIITTTYYGWELGGYPVEISLTTAPNAVMCFGKPENRNEAAKRGIQVSLVPGAKHAAIHTYDEMRGLGMRGDTVDVVLDLTNASPEAAPDSAQTRWAFMEAVNQRVFDDLVAQTFSCILLNGRRRWPEVKFVSLEVRGPDQYSRFEGVHSLATVPQLGGTSQWTSEHLLHR